MVEVQTPAEGVQMLMHRWVMLTGTVLNRDTGEPVEDFEVSSPGDIDGLDAVEVSTPDGHFEVEVEDTVEAVSIDATGFLFWTSSNYLNLEGKETYGLGEIELDPAHTVRGRITDKHTQLPIEHALLIRIAIEEGIFNPWIYNNVQTTTNAEGEFELVGFPAVEGMLSVSKQGYRSVTVPVEDSKSFLEIELEQKSGSISGKVVTQNGQPVYPAYIRIGGSGRRNNEDGSFTFTDMAGTYRLSASAESGRAEVLEVQVENGEHITGLELVINENEFGRVYGTVLGLEDDETAQVIVVDEKGNDVASDGTYEVRGIPVGEYELMCRTSSGRQLTKTMKMDETLDARIDFAFRREVFHIGSDNARGKPGRRTGNPSNARE